MAGREKWGELSPKELIVHPGARQAIEAEIETATASFGESEKIRKFTLLARDFAAEEGEITPTMKVRRRVIFEHFASEIDAMYKT